MTLIMLCGQGNIGKSTYGAKMIAELPNATLVRMDTVVGDYNKKNNTKYHCIPDIHLPIFWKEINKALNNPVNDYVIIDLAHDHPSSRKNTLQHLDLEKIEHFITISLRPPMETVVEWAKKRAEKFMILTEEDCDIIRKVYKGFQAPTDNEFKDYPFKSVTNIVIDNSKPFNLNNLNLNI